MVQGREGVNEAWAQGGLRPRQGAAAASPEGRGRGLRSDAAVLDYSVDSGWGRSRASSASDVVDVEMQCCS